jgi:hypothetical protein
MMVCFYSAMVLLHLYLSEKRPHITMVFLVHQSSMLTIVRASFLSTYFSAET